MKSSSSSSGGGGIGQSAGCVDTGRGRQESAPRKKRGGKKKRVRESEIHFGGH
jgi:hypothetical protein